MRAYELTLTRTSPKRSSGSADGDFAKRSSIKEDQVYNLPNGTWIVYKDSSTKSWYGFKVDAEENQMGESLFAYRKRDLLNDIKRMPDNYGTEEY